MCNVTILINNVLLKHHHYNIIDIIYNLNLKGWEPLDLQATFVRLTLPAPMRKHVLGSDSCRNERYINVNRSGPHPLPLLLPPSTPYTSSPIFLFHSTTSSNYKLIVTCSQTCQSLSIRTTGSKHKISI